MTDHKQKAFAKKLAQLCLHNGQAAKNRVDDVIASLEPFPPTRRRALLKLFLKALERELAQYQAVVEHAGELDEAAQLAILDQLKKEYGHTLTLSLQAKPELIAGVRVRVADDVFDASVRTRLNHLSVAVA